MLEPLGALLLVFDKGKKWGVNVPLKPQMPSRPKVNRGADMVPLPPSQLNPAARA